MGQSAGRGTNGMGRGFNKAGGLSGGKSVAMQGGGGYIGSNGSGNDRMQTGSPLVRQYAMKAAAGKPHVKTFAGNAKQLGKAIPNDTNAQVAGPKPYKGSC